MIHFNTKINSFLLKALIVLSFFPYLSIIDLPSDTQPYALLLSVFIVLFLSDFKIPKPLNYYVLFIILFLPLLGIYSGMDLLFVRSSIGYLSLFIISWASYILFRYNSINKKFFRNIVIIWFIFGIIQMFLFPQFGSQLISGFRTTEERGVVSLAPEPSYYGIICIFFLLLNVIWFKSKTIYLLSSIQIIFFSQSFMIIVYLFLFYYFLLLSNVNLKSKLILIFAPIIGYYFLAILFSELVIESSSRTLKLFSYFFDNPFLVFKIDASANDRLAHIYYSIKGAFDNFLFPKGFSHWEEYINSQVKTSNFFWWNSSGRIMSTYGSALFEFGFLGISIPYIINYLIFKSKKRLENTTFFLFLFLNVFLLGAIPLAFPPLGILVGYLLYLKSQLHNEKYFNKSITPIYSSSSDMFQKIN